MPMAASEIERLIKEAMPDADIRIEDLRGDGDHYLAHVVSDAFAGKTRVQQHQMIYEALQRSSLSLEKIRYARPICFWLLTHLMRCARALAFARAGKSMPARIAMMAITTNSSMSVKAPTLFLRRCWIMVFLFGCGAEL